MRPSSAPAPPPSSRLERVRLHLFALPRVSETMQWGGLLVYWVLDRAVGGKIFAIINPEPHTATPIAFAAGPERKLNLLEMEGIRPAPHLARAHWVALEEWSTLLEAELCAELTEAHGYVAGRMPPRLQRLHELPLREYRALVKQRRTAAKEAR